MTSDSRSFFRIDFTKIWFFRVPIPYRNIILPNIHMTENRFSESILPKVFYPNGVKSEKYLLKKFVCEETPKTVKKFRSDPEEPLNKLPIKEIDTLEQTLW